MTQDPLQGRVLQGRYTLQKKLGEGSFGVVYEAQEEHSQRPVSIKLLRATAIHEEDISRFRREARIIAKLTHPGAVQIYDYGQTPDGIHWIAMELITGETLAARMSQGPLSEEALRALLIPLLESLGEVHAQGIVHRDLTPANIILSQSQGREIPRILDFGIASLRGDGTLTASTLVSGTPRYMSPEQWRGLKNADPRSDLYSLGVISYEALAGCLPFQATSPISWMRAHCHTPPKPLGESLSAPQASSTLQAAIMKSLAKEPSERFQTAGEFLAALLNP